MKRIVFVITLGSWGGAQAHIYDLIQHQAKLGKKVWLITGTEGRLTQQVLQNLSGVTVITIPAIKRQISLYFDIKAVLKVRKLLKEIHPDIVHVHSAKGSVVGRFAAIGIVPVVYTVHGWAFTTGAKRSRAVVATFIEKALQPFTASYICVSKFDYKLGKSRGLMNAKHPGVVIHNGVHQLITPSIDSVACPLKIVMAARFAAPKRQDLLIRAVSQLEKGSVELILLGDGPQLQACQELAESLKVASSVIFAGSVTNVQAYYHEADVVSLISDYEALPISIIEALATGRAVIASNVGGIDEIVTNNGFLMENDPVVIASYIQQLIDNQPLLLDMDKNALINFAIGFESEQMLIATQRVYDQLVN